MNKTEEMVWNLAEPMCAEENLELVDVEFVKEGEWYLRVFIDTLNEESIDLEHCRIINKRLGDILDEQDLIAQAYRLEVSSPGIERALKKDSDFVRFKGKKIRVRLFKTLDGEKELIGILGDTTESELKLLMDEEVIIPRDIISKVNLVWDFV